MQFSFQEIRYSEPARPARIRNPLHRCRSLPRMDLRLMRPTVIWILLIRAIFRIPVWLFLNFECLHYLYCVLIQFHVYGTTLVHCVVPLTVHCVQVWYTPCSLAHVLSCRYQSSFCSLSLVLKSLGSHTQHVDLMNRSSHALVGVLMLSGNVIQSLVLIISSIIVPAIHPRRLVPSGVAQSLLVSISCLPCPLLSAKKVPIGSVWLS